MRDGGQELSLSSAHDELRRCRCAACAYFDCGKSLTHSTTLIAYMKLSRAQGRDASMIHAEQISSFVLRFY